MCFVNILLFAVLAVVSCEEFSGQPLYKYRYQTEDVMKTAASSVPVHGYHVVEGGYYPVGAGGLSSGGFGGGYVSPGGFSGGRLTTLGGIGQHGLSSVGGHVGGHAGGHLGGHLGGHIGGIGSGFGSGVGYEKLGPVGFGGAGFGSSGVSGGLVGGGHYLGHHQLHHPYGGEEIDKKIYSGEKKNVNDNVYEKASGKKGEEINQDQHGYTKGQTAVQEGKGDSGYYSDVEGGKKVFQDGKQYQGDQQFNQEGKKGEEKNTKTGHRKGHKVKGFKTSHHKDESGKTEEFYDEANDEGDNYNFHGQSGSFGESGGSSYKGGHEDGKFNKGEAKKEGHYNNEHVIDKSNADQGKYGENKYAGNGVVYGKNNGYDQESLLGHQENERIYKHHPYHVPFYRH